MKRDIYIEKLEKWCSSSRRKPLILEGARQVGKTWLMREFASTHFPNVVYARFDKNVVLKQIFDRDFDVERILRDLEVLFHTKIDPANTILLFDEIQACRNALTSLKYFCEDRPDIPIIAAGSLLGLAYRDSADASDDSLAPDVDKTTGFPVGKVNTLPIFPMTFEEFLIAIGEEGIAEAIRQCNWTLLADLHEKTADLLRRYYVVGGMPEAVSAFVESQNFIDVRIIHREILMGYQRDIAKHAPKHEVQRIEMCWKSIPAQLAKENKKFTYADVKKGGRSAEFRNPLAWLEEAGLIHLVERVAVPKLPLHSYTSGAFKVYVLDVGLLATLSGLMPEIVLEGSRIFTEFKGALTEQFVCQELLATTDLKPYFWSTDDSRTEIDFILQCGMSVVPLEVKAEENVRSQSLKSYERRFIPSLVFRASMLPFIEQVVQIDTANTCMLHNFPLYAISSLLSFPVCSQRRGGSDSSACYVER